MPSSCADAATFYRAVDHGLRLISGHTEGDLPQSEQTLETLTRLIHRWVPDHLADQPRPPRIAADPRTHPSRLRPAV